ncbi:MAG: hypothetical protein DMF93_24225 [Acidobacteria bacterium]|nr:MAG: hypothetical protein DMF93_24225 [Acidobacteriota bacterium]
MTMRTLVLTLAAVALGAAASAQTAPATLRLSVDDAVKMALDDNVDLRADRLDPQISDTRVAAAAGVFRPTIVTALNSNNQLQPPSSFLVPAATKTDVVTTNAGLSQRLPRFGTSYSLGWTMAHTSSNSFLNSYNPVLQSGLSLNVSQPLIRDLFIDPARQQLAVSRTNRDIADTRLRESLVHTTASVKSAYWNLVSARATVDARRSALDLAQELVKQAEDRLRVLIFDPTKRENWNVQIEAIDSPPVGTAAVDVDAAVTRALAERADLQRARKDIENAQIGVKYADNQRLPDVRLNASYAANGLGGTQVLRAGGFPGTIVGPGQITPVGTVLSELFSRDFPTWSVGVSVSYPIGESSEQANLARAKLERSQSDERLKSAQARAIQQVRDAAWKIEMNAKRIETTRAARELAEQRLDAERKRYEVGMSTSFLVIQAQRDLAQTKNNELGAVLAYDLSLVDFDALQEAGPAGQSPAPASATASAGSIGAPTAVPAVGQTSVAGATAGVPAATPGSLFGRQ